MADVRAAAAAPMGHMSWSITSIRQSDLFRKIAGTFATRILLIGVGMATSVLVARTLGPEGRGLYALMAAIMAVVTQFGNLGLHASNTYAAAKHPEHVPSLLANTIVLSLGGGAALALIAFEVFRHFPSMIALPSPLLALALCGVPFCIALLLLQNLLLGVHRVRIYNLIDLITRSAAVLLIGALIVTQTVTVERAFAVTIVTSIIGSAWGLWALRDFTRKDIRPSYPLFLEYIPYGFKAYLGALFAYLTLRFDVLMVQHYLGVTATGYYSIATALADLVYLLPIVVGTILFPKLTAMTRPARWRLTCRAALGVGVAIGLVALALGLVAGPCIRLLYGASFLPAVPAVWWLLPGIVLLSVNTIFMNYFASDGMPWVTVVSPAIALIVNVFLNTRLLPTIGIAGASMASTVAYGLMLASSIVYLSFRNPIRRISDEC